jgi:CRP/FNR family transcriptional regulator
MWPLSQQSIDYSRNRHLYHAQAIWEIHHHVVRRYSAGQVFCPAGNLEKQLYIIVSGFTKTWVLHETGEENVLGFGMPGDVIGLDGLAPVSTPAQVSFLTDAVMSELPLEKARRIEIAASDEGSALSDLISRELLRSRWRNRYARCTCARRKVTHFLLEMAKRFDEINSPSHRFRLFMPREDVANFLCMTKWTLSRTLHILCSRGLIGIDGRWIEIIDADGLTCVGAADTDETLPT